jgi:hypothetical protein
MKVAGYFIAGLLVAALAGLGAIWVTEALGVSGLWALPVAVGSGAFIGYVSAGEAFCDG